MTAPHHNRHAPNAMQCNTKSLSEGPQCPDRLSVHSRRREPKEMLLSAPWLPPAATIDELSPEVKAYAVLQDGVREDS